VVAGVLVDHQHLVAEVHDQQQVGELDLLRRWLGTDAGRQLGFRGAGRGGRFRQAGRSGALRPGHPPQQR
jgi:hypothetical protein